MQRASLSPAAERVGDEPSDRSPAAPTRLSMRAAVFWVTAFCSATWYAVFSAVELLLT